MDKGAFNQFLEEMKCQTKCNYLKDQPKLQYIKEKIWIQPSGQVSLLERKTFDTKSNMW
jgi:hypothetical protein